MTHLFSNFGINIGLLMTKADRVQAIPPATKCFVYNRPTKVPVVKLEPLTADMVLTKIEELKDSADARFNDLKRKFMEDDEDFFEVSNVVQPNRRLSRKVVSD